MRCASRNSSSTSSAMAERRRLTGRAVEPSKNPSRDFDHSASCEVLGAPGPESSLGWSRSRRCTVAAGCWIVSVIKRLDLGLDGRLVFEHGARGGMRFDAATQRPRVTQEVASCGHRRARLYRMLRAVGVLVSFRRSRLSRRFRRPAQADADTPPGTRMRRARP